jgi:hypothetical protein
MEKGERAKPTLPFSINVLWHSRWSLTWLTRPGFLQHNEASRRKRTGLSIEPDKTIRIDPPRRDYRMDDNRFQTAL